jgi:hypothetical protein
MRAGAVLLLVSLAGGCATGFDPAAKADIDRRVTALRPPAQTIPAPTASTPLAPAVGQWTQHVMVDDQGRPSFLTMKLVGEDLGSYWLELLEETYSGRRLTQLLIYFGDRTALDIRAIKTRIGTGPVKEATREELGTSRADWAGILSMLAGGWEGAPQEESRVPAGIFGGAYQRQIERWGPFQDTSKVWLHPAVPISGVVRSQSTQRKNRLELIAFGERGGVTEFTE